MAISNEYRLSYPVFRRIWLHILADPSQSIAMAIRFRTINQTILPVSAAIPDPS